MPRNTAAGKAATGPINTSNSKTVTVLTVSDSVNRGNSTVRGTRKPV